jgi:hypothetical protein
MKKSTLTEDKAEKTPTGGVLVGKRQGQTIIHNKGTLSGYLVGKTHAEGGIKAVNKSTGQALEMQGGEVVITAPAVSDTTKNEFNGKMMTNREILSEINEKGGGVSFAKGGDVPKNIKRTGASYKYGGKTMTDHEIYKHITGGHLADGMTLSQIAKKHKVSLKELQKQVDMGMKAESEHTPNKREQMKIVKDHLFENPKYYTVLKKAGLKQGGRVRRDSLVRDSKKGNTPARDLNNYNDVLDIDADGIYGAETGLFNNGGAVKEVVEYITIGNQSEYPFPAYDELQFYSFISFKDFIRDLYESEGVTNKRLIYLCVNNTDSFSEANINISKSKNTNRNYNPFTGSFDAFFKNISDKLVARKYDWYKWSGVKTAKATPSQTSKPANKLLTKDELWDSKIWIGDDVVLKDKVIAKLFEMGIPLDDSVGDRNFQENIHIIIYSKDFVVWSDKKINFDRDRKKEIFASDLFPTATASTSTSTPTSVPIDLDRTRIWIGDNPALSEKIQKRAFELGWGDGVVSDTKRNCIFFREDKTIVILSQKYSQFEGYNTYKEIFESDLFPTSTATATTSTPTSVPFDLKEKKIWFGNNPALSEKIQKRAFELGFDWWGGDGTPKNLEFENLFFDRNEKITSASGRANFDSFSDFEEITEADLFPTSTATASASGNATQQSNTQTQNNIITNDIAENIADDNKVIACFFTDKNANENVRYYLKKIWENFVNIFEQDINAQLFFHFENKDNKKISIKTKVKYGTNGFEGDDLFILKNITKDAFYLLIFYRFPELDFSNVLYDFEIDFYNEFKSTQKIFSTSTASQTSTQNAPVENEDWVKKFTADLDKLVVPQNDPAFTSAFLSKEHTDLDALIKLLPSFQQSKYAVERAKILKEIKKLHYKLTYEGFIKPNEALSSDANLFTPQGLLDYYFTQATQNPTAELEPACELPTPNGEKSKLPMSAYLNVRTPQFKNWFGDWEKAYETGNYVNCSKMIDPDTKEPKIYFHGVRKYVPNFGQFSNMGQGVTRPYGAFEPPSFPASYFAGEEDYAKFYGGVAENMPTPSADYKPFIYKVFLSVKNPISLLPLDFMLSYKDFMDYIYVGYGVKVEPNQELLKTLNNDMIKKNPMWIYVRRDIGFIEKLKDYGYDALFQMGDIPTFLPNGEVEPDRTKHLQEVEYLTFYPSQVKSATVKKSFYFDFFNDIRFKNGGYVRI